MNTNILTSEQKQTAQHIWDIIQQSQTILLHCHPNPDPDSIGSTMATKYALEQIGKKVTVIRGDSIIPDAFKHIAGVSSIVEKEFSEVDVTEFDLFIAEDSGSVEMVSRKNRPVFPLDKNPNLKVVVIDHHASNTHYGNINLVATQYQSTTEILFDLFQEWGIRITPEIAEPLYAGLFTDGGGFRYERITDHSFYMSAVLYQVFPGIINSIKILENTATKGYVDFLGLALSQKKEFSTPKGDFVISYVTQEDIKRLGLDSNSWSGNLVCNILKAVTSWNVAVLIIEEAPGVCKASFRTRDADQFNVSKVAVALGGGGHPSASGVLLRTSVPDAISRISSSITEILFS